MPGARRLPAHSRIQLPAEDCPHADAITLDGVNVRNITITGGVWSVRIAADGGAVYYAVNGVLASANSGGYVPDGTQQTIGPIANFTSLSLFSPTADTVAHLVFCGVGGSVVWDQYIAKVLRYAPIAYWPLNETSGTVAHCLVNGAQNGTYSSDVSAMGTGMGIGDGNTAAYFDGANDYCNIYTATFDAAFNGATGSAIIWCRVNAAGTWTDGAGRYALNLRQNNDNQYVFRKSTVNNVLNIDAEAGNGAITFTSAANTTTDWIMLGLTWSDSNNADEAKSYQNGSQFNVTSAALNAWAVGGLAAANTMIGAINNTPVVPWHGWLAHAAVFDYVLNAVQMLDLATV